MSWSSEPYFPARCLVSVLSFSCWLLSFNTPSRPADNCRMTNSFRIKFCNIFDRSGVLSVMWDASRSLLWRTFLFLSSDVSEWQWWSLCCCCCRGVSLYISFSFLFFLLFKTQLMFSIVTKKKGFFFSFNYLVCTLVISSMMSHIYMVSFCVFPVKCHLCVEFVGWHQNVPQTERQIICCRRWRDIYLQPRCRKPRVNCIY